MRTLKLVIAYDGTPFEGWQIQNRRKPRPDGLPTIQGTLEQELSRITQSKVSVQGSGRTDTGVHALAQVAHCRVKSSRTCDQLRLALNQLLPDAITIRSIEEAPPDFHARFKAKSKRYRYRVDTQTPLPFDKPFVHPVNFALNLAKMRRSARELVGEHDFKAFARAGSARTTVRRIDVLEIRRKGSEVRFEVEGSGFLHMMVRSIVGTLLDVGRGRLAETTVRKMLHSGDRRLAGSTAPAKGLVLVKVDY